MNYYENIKQELINNEINRKVKNYSINKSDLTTYYNVGKLLVEAQGGEEKSKYGDKLIKEYSKRLTQDLGKGYSTTNLKYMRKFFIFQKGQPVVDQLTWSHYIILLSIQNTDEINYYINQILDRNLSKRQLREIIKNNEYERLPEKTKVKLITKEEPKVEDLIKNPILIKNSNNYENISEKVLQTLILEDIPSFLEELGTGFTFIKMNIK